MSVLYKISDLTKIQINNIVKNLSFQAIDPHEEELKKWNKAKTHTPNTKPVIQMYMVEDGTHIKIPYSYACKNLGYVNINNYPKAIINNIPTFELQLRENQIEYALSALEYLKTKNTVIIGLNTGFGKSIIGIWLWYVLGLIGCGFFHRETILKQWEKTITDCVPDMKDKIWIVGDRELKDGEIPLFILCMNQRHHLIPKYLIPLIGTIIVDECHLFCTPTNREPLLFFQPKYMIMETATLKREDKLERMIYAITDEHGIFQKLTTKYSIYKINTGIKEVEEFTTRGINCGALYKALSENEYRNNIILNIIKNNPHRKFMILSKLANHIDILKKLFIIHGLECDTLFGGKNTYNDSNILLGTISKLSTGFDEQNACKNFKGIKSNVLILTHSVKSIPLFTQIKGRMRYEDGLIPIFIWLADKNNMIKRHFKELSTYMEESNADIYSMDYMEDNIILPNT